VCVVILEPDRRDVHDDVPDVHNQQSNDWLTPMLVRGSESTGSAGITHCGCCLVAQPV
jgi:hypothetical protein